MSPLSRKEIISKPLINTRNNRIHIFSDSAILLSTSPPFLYISMHMRTTTYLYIFLVTAVRTGHRTCSKRRQFFREEINPAKLSLKY